MSNTNNHHFKEDFKYCVKGYEHFVKKYYDQQMYCQLLKIFSSLKNSQANFCRIRSSIPRRNINYVCHMYMSRYRRIRNEKWISFILIPFQLPILSLLFSYQKSVIKGVKWKWIGFTPNFLFFNFFVVKLLPKILCLWICKQ